MKCSRNDLYNSLTALCRVADKKSTLSILGTVKLEAKGDCLTLTATDLERSLRTRIVSQGDFSACVSIDRLAKIIKPDGSSDDFIFDQDRGKVTVVADDMRVSLSSVPVADFPDDIGAGKSFEVIATWDAPSVVSALNYVLTSASKDRSRPHLSAVYFESANGSARVVTTDGHRIHTCPLPSGFKGESFSLASEHASRLVEALKLGGDVVVRSSDRVVTFAFGNWEFSTTKPDIDFPAYDQAVPSKDVVAIVSPAKAIAVLKKIKALSATEQDATEVKLDKSLQFRVGDGDDSVVFTLPLDFVSDAFESEPCVFGINPRYLSEAIQGATSPVCISCQGEMNPIRLDIGERMAVIMPMRL